ncbi:unnamed protein product, partial [Linum tenue]
TASTHIITAVIGSGVLSLAWSIAQLGWVVGLASLIGFSLITLFASFLLADAYRQVQLCGLAQYSNLVGVTIGYTITASISMA